MHSKDGIIVLYINGGIYEYHADNAKIIEFKKMRNKGRALAYLKREAFYQIRR